MVNTFQQRVQVSCFVQFLNKGARSSLYFNPPWSVGESLGENSCLKKEEPEQAPRWKSKYSSYSWV
ncbi:hypothetical protein COW36_14870 [bacterium (Candidatus Blackallbacteria) CG17_big_fil_post_rev_8_21_14_2_50_48_46]|uniref:Uncharacterized protein n=1 Tax=bacterium (Candidatus Blackallbacteria) CG17_big_fil_post_rev_8_21_14_2_50_48_46 TaxID=2014261 RepID=A0A2M7G2H8_9BACT|nr:MAG: hypothetical protein COW64_11680 [bacterium (Candidatus Blackallbacteria) CG18_big_fil_WC_8_21_14_2_50_49_26]PIW15993.1 MAG: hypothetical protein COW36_14870 [bacterium (Candidatus Blackallbacteria) CG17_big_fil_post_rev_8_21_14_2_50_48_46]PIW50405.1 MAG: hypothetical protein COW20_02585 [bacterium (Candidatus Blackallbacteria) CG13_big_fil_rev_8_21_14_2_50_49_14]